MDFLQKYLTMLPLIKAILKIIRHRSKKNELRYKRVLAPNIYVSHKYNLYEKDHLPSQEISKKVETSVLRKSSEAKYTR